MSQITTCSELVKNRRYVNGVDLSRYDRLHRQGKRLVRSWFNRGWKKIDAPDTQCFDPFIHTWIAFNAWAACVTGHDTDAHWRQALAIHSKVYDDYERLVNDNGSLVSRFSTELFGHWPIFKAQEIRRSRLHTSPQQTRQDIIKFYIEQEIQHYEPQCWLSHHNSNEEVPLDWPHMLSVLYRVRCNLFHGEKSVHSEMDERIVALSFRVLSHFLKEAGYLSEDYNQKSLIN